MGLFKRQKKRQKTANSAATAETNTKDASSQELSADKIKAAAERGDMYAQYTYGLMYYNGEGVPTDLSKAFAWFEASANQGNADAQIAVGMLYDDGIGIEQNKAKALYWYEKAGEQGKADYSYICAAMYDSGIGTAKNKAKAAYWYEKAARQGNADAQLEYGMILTDQGDDVKALEWFEKAAEQGEFHAQFNCGLSYYGDEAVVENPERALHWFMAAFLSNDAVKDERRAYAAARTCTSLFRKGFGTAEQIHTAAGRALAMPVLMLKYKESECNWTELVTVLDALEELRKDGEDILQ